MKKKVIFTVILVVLCVTLCFLTACIKDKNDSSDPIDDNKNNNIPSDGEPTDKPSEPDDGVIDEPTNEPEVWPGTQMTAVEGYDGWFYMETIEADYIIFNNGLEGEDAAQTANILMDDTYTFYNEGWVESIA